MSATLEGRVQGWSTATLAGEGRCMARGLEVVVSELQRRVQHAVAALGTVRAEILDNGLVNADSAVEMIDETLERVKS